MRRILAAAAIVIGMLAGASAKTPEELKQYQEQMVYPTVQVLTTGNKGGSGTIIYSADRGKGVETYVLTNNHVIEEQVETDERFENNRTIKKEEAGYFTVSIPQYVEGSRYIGTIERRGVLVYRDSKIDLAVLKLTDDVTVMPHVATIADESHVYQMGDDVWVVGGGFLLTPFVTQGLLNPSHIVNFDGRERVMHSVDVVPGNSGGGLYQMIDGQYQLTGVPSVSTENAWHVSFSVKLVDIYTFLKAAGLRFIVDRETDSDAPTNGSAS